MVCGFVALSEEEGTVCAAAPRAVEAWGARAGGSWERWRDAKYPKSAKHVSGCSCKTRVINTQHLHYIKSRCVHISLCDGSPQGNRAGGAANLLQ